MDLGDKDVARTFEKCQEIMDVLKAVVRDGMPYKKQLLLLTKRCEVFPIMYQDLITIVSGLLFKNLSGGFDRFSFHEKDKSFRFLNPNRSVQRVFAEISGREKLMTSIEHLICIVLCEIENLAHEYPEHVRIKANLFLHPVKGLKPRKSRF